MSKSDSSSTSGSGSEYSDAPRVHANASPKYVATGQASYAALRNLPIRPIVQDDNWHSNSAGDFHQRFHTGRHYLPGEPRSVAPGSNASSMAVTFNPSQYSSSLYTPSLAGSYAATASSGPSVRTSSGGSVLSRYQAPGRLEEGDDGVLQRPAASRWQCPFWFLRCNEWLDSVEAWDLHCQSHFRGPQNLPKTVQCPFGCSWSYEGASGANAWRYRWMHVHTHHSGGGGISTAKRPDPSLVEHLWRIGVITSAQKKELRTNGFLGDEAYLESANSSRDRRRERRPGEGRPVRSGNYQVVRR